MTKEENTTQGGMVGVVQNSLFLTHSHYPAYTIPLISGKNLIGNLSQPLEFLLIWSTPGRAANEWLSLCLSLSHKRLLGRASGEIAEMLR